MDAPETQNSLDCDGHAALFPNWNHRFKESPTGGVGTVGITKNNTKYQCQKFWQNTFHKIVEYLKLEPSTFHPLPHVKIPLPQEVFPPQILVRGHGRLCSSHPPPPWPRWAAARPTRGRSWAAKCSGVLPREDVAPWPKPANRTQRNGRGEKLWENFGTSKDLKSQSFGNCGHSNSSLKFKHCCFEMSWGHRIALTKTVCLWYSIEAVSVDNWTQTYFNSRRKVRLLLRHWKF